jgi:hypothetical protein
MMLGCDQPACPDLSFRFLQPHRRGGPLLLPMSPGWTEDSWSGREDLNLRPPGPEDGIRESC